MSDDRGIVHQALREELRSRRLLPWSPGQGALPTPASG